MQVIVGIVTACTLARPLDIVIAGNGLDVGEQPGLPEGRDDGERLVECARRRVVHQVPRDQQDAIGDIREARHLLANRGRECLDGRKQPARSVQMQVGNLRNDERSIHFAPLICKCCAAQNDERNASTTRFRPHQPGMNLDTYQPRAAACLRSEHAARATQSKMFVNNATTATLVKPCGRALANGSCRRERRDPPVDGFVSPGQYSMASRLRISSTRLSSASNRACTERSWR